MTDDWNATREEYTGDVRLGGGHETPVGLRGAEDVFVGTDAVSGTLRLDDVEYVYTDVAPGGDATVAGEDVATAVTGDLEDGYVEDVDGDVVVTDVEDVFVEHGAAETVVAPGAEQVFHDDTAAPTGNPDDYDVRVTGWNHSREARDPRDGVAVRGAKNEVTVREATERCAVVVTGWDNEVRVEGRDVEVTAFFVGRDNRVSVGPYASVTTAAESGFDNVTEADPIPPDAVVRTTKAEAHADAFIGRHRITWQEPADEEWCPNCGSDADAVVARRQKDALFLFGVPVRTYDDGDASYECEHCSPHALGDVDLSEEERKRVLQ